MTTDRSRRRPYSSAAPVVLLALIATLLLAGWDAHQLPGNQLQPLHLTAVPVPGHGHGGPSLWLPRAQQPDRAGWNDLPVAVLGAGLVLTAGVVSLVRRRRSGAASSLTLAPSFPRAPPARVSTS